MFSSPVLDKLNRCRIYHVKEISTVIVQSVFKPHFCFFVRFFLQVCFFVFFVRFFCSVGGFFFLGVGAFRWQGTWDNPSFRKEGQGLLGWLFSPGLQEGR